MTIPLIVNQEQNASFMLSTLKKQSDRYYEDTKHRLHIIYDQQEFILTLEQSKDANILRGLMTAVIMTKSGFANSFADMLQEFNKHNG